MSYKQVIIKTAYRIFLKENSLCVLKNEKDDECEIKIPLEDISIILLEDSRAIVTARLLSELSKNNITMVFCDETYKPSTITIPLNQHYNQFRVFNMQLSLEDNVKKEAWRKIVTRKIINQKRVIELTTIHEYGIALLEKYSEEVKDNDVDNREGIASKVFFNSLYGLDFVRSSENPINSALDYGYTIMHSSIVRQLVSMGCNTFLGIWHDSDQNSTNLASDFVEVFRPVVDYYVFRHIDELDKELSAKTRRGLVNLLNANMIVNDKICNVEYAMEVVIKSYIKMIESHSSDLLVLPNITELEFNE